MIVNARDGDPDAKEIIDLVKNHSSGEGPLGDFSDEKVPICYNFLQMIIILVEGRIH